MICVAELPEGYRPPPRDDRGAQEGHAVPRVLRCAQLSGRARRVASRARLCSFHSRAIAPDFAALLQLRPVRAITHTDCISRTACCLQHVLY